MKLPAEDCPHWEKCSAPICPLDPSGAHLSGERVCRLAREIVKEGGFDHVSRYAGQEVAIRVRDGLPRMESIPDIARSLARAAASSINTGRIGNLRPQPGTPTAQG